MKYKKVKKATFLNRPNRFVAYCMVDGQQEKVHVCNTGRCKELLVPNATVYLVEGENPARSTKYDLMVVEKQCEDGQNRLINMDSYAPNRVAAEWLTSGAFRDDMLLVKPETKYGNSRFDFYLEYGDPKNPTKAFMEVKGVTLEENGHASFPDAPTERGVKHLKELMEAKEKGYEAYVLFVVQMEQISSFSPNEKTHREFAKTLNKAQEAGVHILVRECKVTENTLEITKTVPCNIPQYIV